MWSSKMAAPRRGKDGDLNAGNGDFPCGDTHNEFSLCRSDVSSQSCVDHHSILAIFEDSAISSEDKSSTEMESETLLSALTEMLDCVEDDVEVLSPFDTLPDTKLLRCPERRSQLADEACIADRLRPRSKPSLETLTEEENKADRGRVPPDLKQREPTRFQPKTTKPESEVEVFTSTSLVNLVRIMHPYCLRMHVEEEDKPRRRRAVFSQEEVWRYQRPTGDSDEEINVVSDEEAEATLEGRKEGTETANGKLLKSALLNGGSARALASRGKKRVSFGAIQVASFDEPTETRDEKAAPAQTNEAKAPESQQQETSSEKVGEPPPKAEAKAKSLSLQQYRQLRQKRQPLVEKQGNYTTKWPSVPEAPKELTPILCLQGRGPANRAPSQQAPLPQPSVPVPARRGGALTRLRAEAQIISPISPLPDAAAEARRQTAPVSSDPPNPVLLRLPAEPSPHAPQPPPCSSAALPSHLRNSEQCSAPQETKTSKPTSTHAQPHSDSKSAHHIPTVPKNPQGAPPSSVPTTCQEIPTPAEDTSPAGSSTLPPVEGLKPDRRERTMAGDSGIEAPDLTSLLEQFEEKQAKAEGGSEQEPNAKADSATLPLNLHSLDDAGAERPQTPSRAAPLKASEVLPDVQTVPEPLGTEVVLSAQGEQTARRKSPASKAIQIIDPRPLPPKRTNSGGSEVSATHSSPHALSSVAADHDYCAASWQRQPPTLRDADKSTANVQTATPNLSAAECKKQLPVAATTILTARAVPATAGPQQMSRPDSNPPTDRASEFSGQSDAGKEQVAPCTLPTPPPSPPSRGREKRRYRRRSPRSHSSSPSSSSSSSSSESRSPKRPRLHYKRSESSSCSSSSSSSSCSPPRRYRLSRSRSRCSRSRSRSWSQSRSRSRSPHLPLPRRTYRHRWRDVCSSRESRRLRREHEMRIQKLKAIDERRVVYVGRISRSMTHDELRERFSQFGEVECVSLHFRDKGDHYGFVTFYNMEDAFAAIDNGGKLRRPNELPFDICFGGRRQFCNSDYADLDANRGADLSPARSRFEELDFDSLLKQAQRGQKT